VLKDSENQLRLQLARAKVEKVTSNAEIGTGRRIFTAELSKMGQGPQIKSVLATVRVKAV
jgi:hypothetical protein